MASIFGNFITGIIDDFSQSIEDSRRESREESYDWACRRTDEARSMYRMHAQRANMWLDKLEEAERQLAALEPRIMSGNYSSWDSSEYNILRAKIRRIQDNIRDERREANSAARTAQMREEVEIRRSSNLGRTDWDFDLL